jgi:hypothetical protein
MIKSRDFAQEFSPDTMLNTFPSQKMIQMNTPMMISRILANAL